MDTLSGNRRKMRNKLWNTVFLGLAFSIAWLAFPVTSAWSQWRPQKNVEIISPSGPGSGIDTATRTVERILQEERLLDVSSTVVNKTGGGQAVGLTYLNQHAGDGHTLLVTTLTLLTNYITKVSPLNYTDFTPIAQLYTQSIVFAVRSDSSLKTVKDLLDRLKSDPGSVTFGTSTSPGNHNHALIGIVGKAAGADVKKLKIVFFKSGGESMSAMLGGHIDIVVISVSVVLPHLKAGKLDILAVSAPKRLTGAVSSISTFKEYGIDVDFGTTRFLIGPRGMNVEQIAYWDSVIGRMAKTGAWKQALEKLRGEDVYMNSRDTTRNMKAQQDLLRPVLADLGLAK